MWFLSRDTAFKLWGSVLRQAALNKIVLTMSSLEGQGTLRICKMPAKFYTCAMSVTDSDHKITWEHPGDLPLPASKQASKLEITSQ